MRDSNGAGQTEDCNVQQDYALRRGRCFHGDRARSCPDNLQSLDANPRDLVAISTNFKTLNAGAAKFENQCSIPGSTGAQPAPLNSLQLTPLSEEARSQSPPVGDRPGPGVLTRGGPNVKQERPATVLERE
jgi:hypothetical protein